MKTSLALLMALALVVGGAVAWQRFGPPDHSGAGRLPPAAGTTDVVTPDQPAILLAAGDIATCDDPEVATGELLAAQPGVVAALGDLAYPDGSPSAFTNCYDTAWGLVTPRTRPAMGNHDVRTPDAAGYGDYFGTTAGPQPQGYYSYDLGAWHVVVLNSNCDLVGGCGPDSPQLAWLADDLAATSTGNIVAYWHHPRFSTGHHGDQPAVAAFWETLTQAGADVVLNGHDHDYERFVPMDPAGRPSPTGIREFVVGTGGAPLRDFGPTRDTVGHRQADHHGILRLELQPCGYSWSFLPTAGGEPLDAGSATNTCDGIPRAGHGSPGFTPR